MVNHHSAEAEEKHSMETKPKEAKWLLDCPTANIHLHTLGILI